MTAKAGGGGGWGPTTYGRIAANGDVVIGLSSDFEIAPTDAYSFGAVGLWLYRTSNNCFIRCGCDTAIATSSTEVWYNTGGAGQGAPGSRYATGTDIFELGGVPDSVNIYNKSDTTLAGTPLVFQGLGSSYTSDDKVTFFTPTIDTKYGREVQCEASYTGNFGSDGPHEARINVQFTFRKSGETDYTIEFSGRARAIAEVET